MKEKFPQIIYEREGYIARITLNRPEKLNPIDFVGMGGIADGFLAALDEAEDDDDVKVVIIKGAGRSFCVGRDLDKVLRVYGDKDGRDERRPSQRIRLKEDKPTFTDFFKRIFLCSKVTIAQLHGHVLGAGFEIMSCCDLAIAAENAQLGRPEQRLGAVGRSLDFGNLIMNIGIKKASELYYTSLSISGKEAERIGLLNKAVPEDKLEEEVNRMAETIALMSRDGIAVGKATRNMVFGYLGLTSILDAGYVFHSYQTNVQWDPDEFSFMKARRDKGTTAALEARNVRYKGR